jgi:hypothetical protein
VDAMRTSTATMEPAHAILVSLANSAISLRAPKCAVEMDTASMGYVIASRGGLVSIALERSARQVAVCTVCAKIPLADAWTRDTMVMTAP